MGAMKIIDADGHVFEDAAAISERMPSPYKEKGPFPITRLVPPGDHFHHYVGEHPPGSFRRDTGPDEWVEFLADVGIEMAVLYPSLAPAYGRITNRDWAIAFTQAVSRSAPPRDSGLQDG